jgi:hypothetical protein
MMYKTKVVGFSQILTQHSEQSEYYVEFLDVKPIGT